MGQEGSQRRALGQSSPSASFCLSSWKSATICEVSCYVVSLFTIASGSLPIVFKSLPNFSHISYLGSWKTAHHSIVHLGLAENILFILSTESQTMIVYLHWTVGDLFLGMSDCLVGWAEQPSQGIFHLLSFPFSQLDLQRYFLQIPHWGPTKDWILLAMQNSSWSSSLW